MPDKLVIHPLTRGLRAIRLELGAEGGRIIEAKAGTTCYWDFTETLNGKDPLDALQLTQRSNGLDFVAHSVAAARALEEMVRAELGGNTKLLRNILLALDMVYGHLTHFYQGILPDYIPLANVGPFSLEPGNFVLPPTVSGPMLNNVWRSFEVRQLIHNMMAVLGGKVPHLCSVVFAGETKTLDRAEIIRVSSILKEVATFVNNEYTRDLEQIEKAYARYYDVGRGTGNLLTFGEFYQNQGRLFPAGLSVNSGTAQVDKKMVSTDCTGSFFEVAEGDRRSLGSELKVSPNKSGGYSWVRGAVYDNKPFEVGALARMTAVGNQVVSSLGERAVSVLGRLRARLEESKILISQSEKWLDQYNQREEAPDPVDVPEEGEAIGTAEASHGAVVHYVLIRGGKVARYNVLDSLSWNLCPGTRDGAKGPLEAALVGTMIEAQGDPVDVLRIARAF